ncbi:unnamed protein product [Sphagnum balticum]
MRPLLKLRLFQTSTRIRVPSSTISGFFLEHFKPLLEGVEKLQDQDQGNHLRESWQRSSSADEIFLDPCVDDSRQVLTKC